MVNMSFEKLGIRSRRRSSFQDKSSWTHGLHHSISARSDGDHSHTDEEAYPVTLDFVTRVLKYGIPYWWLFLAIIIGSAGSAWIDAQMPLLYRSIVDDALPKSDVKLLQWLSISLAGTVIGSSILSVIRGWLAVYIGEKIVQQLRSELFYRLQSMPMSFFVNSKSGVYKTLFTVELAGAKSSIGRLLPKMVANIFVLVITLYSLVKLDWHIALLCVVLIPLFHFPTQYVSTKLTTIRRAGIEARARLEDVLRESLSSDGWLLHHNFSMEEFAAKKFEFLSGDLVTTSVRFDTFQIVFEQGLYLIVALSSSLIYYYGSMYTSFRSTSITPGDLVMFAAYIGKLFGPLRDMMNLRLRFSTTAVCFSHIFSFLDGSSSSVQKSEYVEKKDEGEGEGDCVQVESSAIQASDVSLNTNGSGQTVTVNKGIEVKNVSFEYPIDSYGEESEQKKSAQLALCDVNVVFPHSSFIAIVGQNGAGKSTLGLLIARLYDPTHGSVLLDGENIAGMSDHNRRVCLIGAPYLIHSTIRENLLYGDNNAEDSDLEWACNAVGMSDHINSLPQRFDTVVGDRGSKLSGGQSQRISLARALLKKPEVLVLDEVFSHIDGASERTLMKNLREAIPSTTVILICHRNSTVNLCDFVLVLKQGKVVDWGTKGSVLGDRNGPFFDIFVQ